MNNCIFCNLPKDRIVAEYKHFYVIRDAFPVTDLHSLIITKRHVVSYFQCNKEEIDELPLILDTQKTELILNGSILKFILESKSSKIRCHNLVKNQMLSMKYQYNIMNWDKLE